MNKQLLIGQLRQGKTGYEILTILDAITSPASESEYSFSSNSLLDLPIVNVTLPVVNGQPTLEEIAF